MRILLIAEAANPEWTSVPLIGWSLAKALRDQADVHLVTHLRNRAAIERAGWQEGKEFTALDGDAAGGLFWFRLAQRLRGGAGRGWTTQMALASISYRHFERVLWDRFGQDIAAGNYDLVHRITPLSPTVVSVIAPRCAQAGVPFLLGPLNGGAPWPKAFNAERRKEREWLSYIRGIYKWAPGHRAMLESASRIIVGSRHTQADIPRALQSKCVYMPENAVDPERFQAELKSSEPGPLRAAFVGRLVPYKGADMLLEAAEPLIVGGRMRLDIVGDGPMRQELESWITTRGLNDGIQMHGWVPHTQVQDILRGAQVFTFPSVREFGGGAILEAMAIGLVPIVVDYAGPAELVDDTVGFRIPLGSRNSVVTGLRAVLENLTANQGCLPAMSAACRDRVNEHFTWPVKARELIQIYNQVLANHQ